MASHVLQRPEVLREPCMLELKWEDAQLELLIEIRTENKVKGDTLRVRLRGGERKGGCKPLKVGSPKKKKSDDFTP